MSKSPYEFQQAFEDVARKANLKIQTFQIQPSQRLTQMTQALKHFILETEQAYQESKNSKIHFGQKIAHQKYALPILQKRGFSRCI